MECYIVQLNFSAAFDTVSHSGLLLKLKSIGVGGSVLSICWEFLSNRRQRVVVVGANYPQLMVDGESESQSFQACHRDVCLILFCSSYIPAKFWAGSKSYMPMEMTPHYWQLFASQQAYLRLLLPLTRTWLGFRSGAIDDAWYWS